MKDYQHYESVGCILKKEKLATFYPGYPCKYLVLESMEPFPGYYCMIDYQLEKRPVLLYLVLKKTNQTNPDDIIRITAQIKKANNLQFDAAPAEITLYNHNYHAIRLNVPVISQLPEITKAFADSGLVLHRHIDVKPYTSLIRIKRFFIIDKEDENLYHDQVHIENHYIILPEFLSWNDFETITIHIKNNFDFSTFDAAQGFVYDEAGMVDFVRVYVKNAPITDLIRLRDMYLREVARLKPA